MAASWAPRSSLSQVTLATVQAWKGAPTKEDAENGLQIYVCGRGVAHASGGSEPCIGGNGRTAPRSPGGRGFARATRPIPLLPRCAVRMRVALGLGQPTIHFLRGASWLRCEVLGPRHAPEECAPKTPCRGFARSWTRSAKCNGEA